MSAYRQSPLANIPPVVKNLLILNIICFIPTALFSHGDSDPVASLLGGYYFNSPLFRLWQPVTYMFIHGGWQHILFNMIALFFFGPIVEYTLGSKRFLNFYIICGLGAIAIQWGVQAYELHALTGHITAPINAANLRSEEFYITNYGTNAAKIYEIYAVPIVGASGAIFGVMAAMAMLYPNLEMMLLFFPVPIKAKYFIPLYVLFELWAGVFQSAGDQVAHFAHIGGALFGFIMIKMWHPKRPNNFF